MYHIDLNYFVYMRYTTYKIYIICLECIIYI